MDTSNSLYRPYEQARRHLRVNEATTSPESIAAQFGVSPGLTSLLVVVTNRWDRGKDLGAFRADTEAVYKDTSLDAATRAMAAEHRSSADDGEVRLEWEARALALRDKLDVGDAQLLHWSTTFGEWDEAGRGFTPEEVARGLAFMIRFGAHNAPGRVRWWASKLDLNDERSRTEAIGWLGRVLWRSGHEPHAMNEYYLGKVREELDALLAMDVA